MKKRNWLLPILVVLVYLQSCTIEKRRYTSGYHIEWKWSRPRMRVAEIKPVAHTYLHDTLFVQAYTEERVVKENNTLASSQSTHSARKKRSNKEQPLSTPACYRIVMKSGEEIEAKVLEVGVNSVRYKPCGADSATVHDLKKKDVFIVKYPDGRNEIITPFKGSGEDASVKERPNGTLSFVSLGAALLSIVPGLFAFMAPLAIILAIIALATNDRYRGLPIFVLIFAFLLAILFIIALSTLDGMFLL
jgi:hypothetical protein